MMRLKVLLGANLAVAGATSALYFLPRTLFLDDIKSKLEAKKDGVGIPLSKYVRNLVDEVMDDMKLKKEEKELIKPFSHEGVELIHVGCSLNKPGAILGIPQHFCLDYRIPINFVYEADGVEIPLTEPDLMSLKNSMTLSKEAKKFGVACKIFESKHHSFYHVGILPMTFICLINVTLLGVHRYKPFKNKRTDLLFKVYIAILGITLILVSNNISIIQKEEYGNLEAALLGEEYIKGGLEYYEKVLARNKTIKKLHNKAPFSEDGDLYDPFVGLRHVSLSERIKYLKDLQKAVKGNTKIPSIWDYITLSSFFKINITNN